MRKSKQQLKQIKQKYNVSELWSWSKYNTIKNDLYEYYLKYIARIKTDRNDGIYGVSGGVIHDIIEKYYLGELEYGQMIDSYESELFNMNRAKLKYDRTNEEKNNKISKKYEECIKHFFKNHTIIQHKLITEKFITIKIDKFIFQGYIDAIHKEKRDGKAKIIITDWKSSSLYQGKKIDKEKGQLVLYAEGIRQMGVPLENIIIRWNFLKYINVEYTQSKGEKKTRIIERNQIGAKLKSNVKMWLKKSKEHTDEEIEKMLNQMSELNSIEFLPKNIKNKFKIMDCYVEIPLNQQVIDELKEDIIETIINVKRKEIKYNETHDDKIFWQEVDDEHSYFMANLSGYSRKIHKPYDEYLKELEMFKDDNNEDMSWLEEL